MVVGARLVAIAVAALAVAAAPAGGGAPRDDTVWLQALLDAGDSIYLPKLLEGECYQTHGLWVSHDDTRIVSNGACIVSLGPGSVRLVSNDGDPIAADSVFFINRSDHLAPAPDHVTIRGLKIVVPASVLTSGISIFGHDVTISHVTVTGAPVDDVLVGERANGDGYASRVEIDHCYLEGGGRNVVSAVTFLNLRIEYSTLAGASNGYRGAPVEGGNPAAGIDVEPNKRGNLMLGLVIAHNLIRDNAGPGILFALVSSTGLPLNADRFSVVGNKIVRNGKSDRAEHGGIVFYGGQADGRGRATVSGNLISGNRGAALVGWKMTMTVDAHDNDLRGNGGGAYQNVKLAKSRR